MVRAGGPFQNAAQSEHLSSPGYGWRSASLLHAPRLPRGGLAHPGERRGGRLGLLLGAALRRRRRPGPPADRVRAPARRAAARPARRPRRALAAEAIPARPAAGLAPRWGLGRL